MNSNRSAGPFLSQFYRGNRLHLLVASVAALAISAVNLAVTWIIQQLMDTVSGVSGSLPLSALALLAAAAVAAIVLLKSLSAWAKPRFLKRALEQYKAYAFERLIRKSAASFGGQNTAVYLSMFTNDLNTLEAGYLKGLFELIFNAVLFCGSLAMMLCYNPTLTLIACAFFSLPVCAALFTSGPAAAAEKSVSEANGRFLATLKDCLGGFAAVKCFQAEDAVARQFGAENRLVESAKRRKNTLAALIDTAAAAAGVIAQLGVFLAGGYLALSGRSVTPGILLAFIDLTGSVLLPVQSLPGLWAQRRASLALVEKLAAALEEPSPAQGIRLSSPLAQGITLQNACAGCPASCAAIRAPWPLTGTSCAMSARIPSTPSPPASTKTSFCSKRPFGRTSPCFRTFRMTRSAAPSVWPAWTPWWPGAARPPCAARAAWAFPAGKSSACPLRAACCAGPPSCLWTRPPPPWMRKPPIRSRRPFWAWSR